MYLTIPTRRPALRGRALRAVLRASLGLIAALGGPGLTAAARADAPYNYVRPFRDHVRSGADYGTVTSTQAYAGPASYARADLRPWGSGLAARSWASRALRHQSRGRNRSRLGEARGPGATIPRAGNPEWAPGSSPDAVRPATISRYRFCAS
jgi:hypothetical protein